MNRRTEPLLAPALAPPPPAASPSHVPPQPPLPSIPGLAKDDSPLCLPPRLAAAALPASNDSSSPAVSRPPAASTSQSPPPLPPHASLSLSAPPLGRSTTCVTSRVSACATLPPPARTASSSQRRRARASAATASTAPSSASRQPRSRPQRCCACCTPAPCPPGGLCCCRWCACCVACCCAACCGAKSACGGCTCGAGGACQRAGASSSTATTPWNTPAGRASSPPFTRRCHSSSRCKTPAEGGAAEPAARSLRAFASAAASASSRCRSKLTDPLRRGQLTYGLNASVTGIVAARCDRAAAQWAVVRVGMPGGRDPLVTSPDLTAAPVILTAYVNWLHGQGDKAQAGLFSSGVGSCKQGYKLRVRVQSGCREVGERSRGRALQAARRAPVWIIWIYELGAGTRFTNSITISEQGYEARAGRPAGLARKKLCSGVWGPQIGSVACVSRVQVHKVVLKVWSVVCKRTKCLGRRSPRSASSSIQIGSREVGRRTGMDKQTGGRGRVGEWTNKKNG
eukprot:357827-Chlamydomonas_euryale.AAC.2